MTDADLRSFEIGADSHPRHKSKISWAKFATMKSRVTAYNKQTRYTGLGASVVMDGHLPDAWEGQPIEVLVQWKSSSFVYFVKVTPVSRPVPSSRPYYTYVPLTAFNTLPLFEREATKQHKTSLSSCSSSAGNLATAEAVEEQKFRAMRQQQAEGVAKDALEEQHDKIEGLKAAGFEWVRHKKAAHETGWVMCTKAALGLGLRKEDQGKTWEVQQGFPHAPAMPLIVAMADRNVAGNAHLPDLLQQDEDEELHEVDSDADDHDVQLAQHNLGSTNVSAAGADPVLCARDLSVEPLPVEQEGGRVWQNCADERDDGDGSDGDGSNADGNSGLTDSSDDDDDSDGDDRMQAKRNLFGSDTEEYDNDSDSEACNMLLSK